jgi:uncharacterized protein
VNVAPCPICKKKIADSAEAKSAAPFCSDRCRQIDLGKWLSEDYRMPVSDEEDSDLSDGSGEGHEA